VIWEPDKLLALALSRPSEALAAAREVLARRPPAAQAAVAHQAAGVVFRDFGDIGQAIEAFKNARRFARKAGDLDRESDVSASLAAALVLAGQSRRGLSILDALLEHSQGVPAGRILIRRAGVFYILGRNAEALRDAQAAVDLLTGAGDLVWEARALHWRAAVYLAMGDIQRADRDYARAEALWMECAQQLSMRMRATNAGWPPMPAVTCPPRSPTLTTPQTLLDQLGVFDADFFVNKRTVLLAAGLARDALSDVDAAAAASNRIMARRPGAPSWPFLRSPPPRPPISPWPRSAATRPCGCSGGSSARGGQRGRNSRCRCAGSGGPNPAATSCTAARGRPPGWTRWITPGRSTRTC
jgi:tetratricopeptide (TPR) repeat protein